MPQRWKKLPSEGTLLINTDLHGNFEDFQRMREIFLTHIANDAGTQWAILGDMVHGPDERVRKIEPKFYDYEDQSLEIVEGILALQAEYPDHVHYVLGNHDYGHVGGPHTTKFYEDEVEHLEAEIGEAGVQSLKRLFENALLAVVAPCGAFLTHGSPHDSLKALDDLNQITFPPEDEYLIGLMQTFLTSYGQRGEVTARLLETVSRDCGENITMVIHGHDREPDGYFVEGGNQLCPVIFGAPRENKRYVQLDLSAHYGSVDALRDHYEIRRLYPDAYDRAKRNHWKSLTFKEMQAIRNEETGKLMTFDIEGFKQRLREVIAWCQPRFSMDDIRNSLRTPPIPDWHPAYDYAYSVKLVAEHFQVVMQKQAAAFRNDPDADWDFVGLANGRLMVSWLSSTHEGTSEVETDDFIDDDDVPAWDTWVDLFQENGQPILLSWIPPEMRDMVTGAVETNTIQNIEWVEDIIEVGGESFTFLRELRDAKLHADGLFGKWGWED